MKEFQDFMSSRRTRALGLVLGAFVLALLIFHAGIVVGEHRGRFSRAYERNRDGSFRPAFFPGDFVMPHTFLRGAHGAVGTVSSVSDAAPRVVTLRTREGENSTILVATTTLIQSVTGADTLSEGDQIIALGEPDDQGRIQATMVRILLEATTTP